jgi:hypothetical protein
MFLPSGLVYGIWCGNKQAMDQQDSATYLEEFVNATELLPNDVRRNFELIRELDRDASECIRKCEEAEVAYPEIRGYLK